MILPGSLLRRAFAALLCAATIPAMAAMEAYRIDPAHTMPGFEISHLGISTQRGRFERTTGSISLDREAGTGPVAVEIDASSISTGDTKLYIALRGEDFLDVARYPKLSYYGERVAFERGGPASAEGEFTLLGVSLTR